ncbi:preprotein translocase subunit YajC [Actinoplanes sp. NPDC051346]|uniref:preprotein translocase subunit YajC n=1 Tax=Actinoplanes sp. NPDC051346 TaxID=3155048 RepID=UPI003415A4C0
MPLLLIVLLFGVMYFMMIRPQQKRRREAQAMQSALGAGDEIVTIGGLHATVVAVDDEVVTVEIAPGVNARYARPAIARVLKQESAPVAEEAVVAEPAADEPVQSPVVETRKTKD